MILADLVWDGVGVVGNHGGCGAVIADALVIEDVGLD